MDRPPSTSSASSSSSIYAPVGVHAETLSASSIRSSWSDVNEGSPQYYTIRYSQSNIGEETKLVNTSDTEHIVEGLLPHTQYEFAVRVVGSTQWSMAAINRTLPAAPSSVPIGFSVKSHKKDGEGTSVELRWEPPKYANGDIEEYIVLYSDHLELPDREWIMRNMTQSAETREKKISHNFVEELRAQKNEPKCAPLSN